MESCVMLYNNKKLKVDSAGTEQENQKDEYGFSLSVEASLQIQVTL